MRSDSIRCCNTWLAAAASRALFTVCIDEILIANTELRNRAAIALAMVDSIKVIPTFREGERSISSLKRKQHALCPYSIITRITRITRIRHSHFMLGNRIVSPMRQLQSHGRERMAAIRG